MCSYHISEWCMSSMYVSKLKQNLYRRIHLSYFKTKEKHYKSENTVVWDLFHWISHKKPMLWVRDTSKLQKTVRDCVRLWCHCVRIVWVYCDVTVWELCEDMRSGRGHHCVATMRSWWPQIVGWDYEWLTLNCSQF